MVVCFIALFVFGVMAIFSARYRPFAKEAFNCVFKRMTLRKCDTGFDKKLKAKITGKLMKKSPKTGALVYKNFETISWAFTVILIASLIYSAVGIYNIVVYNNCNGPGSEYCPLTDSYGTACNTQTCTNQNCTCQDNGTCTCPPGEECHG